MEHTNPAIDIQIKDAGNIPDTTDKQQKTVHGEALSPDIIKNTLARVPAMPRRVEKNTEPIFAPGPKPSPRAGTEIEIMFPPEAGQVEWPEFKNPTGKTQILQFSPSGKVNFANQVFISFSQPMIALQNLDTLPDLPGIHLSPEPEGSWRWLGVQTLVFESKLPFPGSTLYHVETLSPEPESIWGNPVEPVKFSFRTPLLKLGSSYHTTGVSELTPVLAMKFTQKINRSLMIHGIRIRYGNTVLSAVPLSSEEIEADKGAETRKLTWPEDQTLWFKPSAKLPKDTQVYVEIPRGAWSTEGPLPSDTGFSFRFKTYAPFKFDKASCGYREECNPGDVWTIRFNNPIDISKFTDDYISITPELPKADIAIYGKNININGLKRENQKYTITLSGEITDIYGQKLEKPKRIAFKTGPSPQIFFTTWDKTINTLPTRTATELYIHSRSIDAFRVRVQKVSPADFMAYYKARSEIQEDAKVLSVKFPGEILYDETMKPGQGSILDLTRIDFSPWLNTEGTGQFIVIAVPLHPTERLWKRSSLSWIQFSNLGIHMSNDKDMLIFDNYRISNGMPVKGVTLTPLESQNNKMLCKDDRIKLKKHDFIFHSFENFWSATSKDDNLIFPIDSIYLTNGEKDTPLWYLASSRGIYKPGEEIFFKGILRWQENSPTGDLSIPALRKKRVTWTIINSRGQEMGKGSSSVNSLGSFHDSFKLPEDAELGHCYIHFETHLKAENPDEETSANYHFQIQEFRTPEFEVQTKNTLPGPYFQDESIGWKARASYYAGGGLSDAQTHWSIKAGKTSYAPPGHETYSFGTQSSWWRCWPPFQEESTVMDFVGHTDIDGSHSVETVITSSFEPSTLRVTAECSIQDLNHQTWTSKHVILVHPSEVFAGLKLDSRFRNVNDHLEGSFIVCDVDGHILPNRKIRLSISPTGSFNNEPEPGKDSEYFSQAMISGKQPSEFKIPLTKTGRFKIRIELQDKRGRTNRTESQIWVFGNRNSTLEETESKDLTLIPEKQEYAPGETAKILVQAPFQTGWGSYALCRSGLLVEHKFHIEGGTTRLAIPIEAVHYPNLSLIIHLQETRSDKNSELPATADGTLNIPVSAAGRTLHTAILPEKTELSPGSDSHLEVIVKDSQGNPVAGSEVLVMMVDEAVLSLTGFNLNDPLSIFYPKRSSLFLERDSSDNILLETLKNSMDQMSELNLEQEGAYPPTPVMMERSMESFSRSAKKNGRSNSQPQPIALRKDFSPLVLFSPRVKTDRHGRARIPIHLKDNLTRYRVMTLAMDGARRFGTSQANVTARLPLMVRPSAPRFLNLGDRFLLPITLQNQTERDMSVNVLIQGRNLSFQEEDNPTKNKDQSIASASLLVPAKDRVLVEFPCRPETSGPAFFQVTAVSADENNPGEDAARISIPVLVPASAEAFATYGEMSGDEMQLYRISKPGDVFQETGGLNLQLSSTQLQTLTDAYLYLKTYPFECSEQLASKLISILMLGDILDEFRGDESQVERAELMGEIITSLSKKQLPSGGFSFWTRKGPEWPFLTLHVTHALVRANSAGLAVPGDVLKKALNAVKRIERTFSRFQLESARNDLLAYAFYVRALSGESIAKQASELWRSKHEDLSRDARCWLASALALSHAEDLSFEILNSLMNEVIQTASTAEFNTSMKGNSYYCFWSSSRENALFLETLLLTKPDHPLATNWIRGLLGSRVKGKWSNTQDNLWNLIAIRKYLRIREENVPDFSTKAWIDQNFIGTDRFKGRNGQWIHHTIPMNALNSDSEFLIQKTGKGRLYYRLGLKYTPLSLDLPAMEQGFAITRSYEALGNPDDVIHKEDGSWLIKAGSMVRVNIRFSQMSSRQHVALVDHLPAGFETVNPALKSSPGIKNKSSSHRYGIWWFRTWFDHQNLRTDRAEAFSTRIPGGSRTYSYVVRATNRGSFIAPPARIEEMYQPETFGRTGTARVVIE